MIDWLIIAGLLLALAIPLISAISARRWHKRRARLAAASGWRYAARGWAGWSEDYVMVGTTPAGFIWELKPGYFQKRRQLEWRAHAAKLPFGTILLLPADEPIATDVSLPLRDQSDLLSELGGWRVVATHRHLAERFVTSAWLDRLEPLTSVAGPGELAAINWGRNGLAIVVRFGRRWQTMRSMVELGVVIADQLDSNRQA